MVVARSLYLRGRRFEPYRAHIYMRTTKAVKPLTKTEKIKHLKAKRQETLDTLTELYKHFHGVKHENSSSEIKYVRIKVLEDFVNTLNQELKSLEK